MGKTENGTARPEGRFYKNLVCIVLITLHYRKLKYTIDDHEPFLYLLAAEAEFDILFSPARLKLTVLKVAIIVFTT